MQNKENKNDKKRNGKGESSETKQFPDYESRVPGVISPDIVLPAINPPVPNRAWTEMKRNIESLSEQEKRDLYFGNSSR